MAEEEEEALPVTEIYLVDGSVPSFDNEELEDGLNITSISWEEEEEEEEEREFGLDEELVAELASLGLPSSFVVAMRLFRWPWCLIWKPKFKRKKQTKKLKKTLQVIAETAKNEANRTEAEALDTENGVPEASSVWVPAWDEYYGRYYFYNHESLETTWDAPQGFEDYVNLSAAESPAALEQDAPIERDIATAEASVQIESVSVSSEDELETVGKVVVKTKLSAKVRKALRDAGLGPSTAKYWFQRYSLFSKYDEGIEMDEEGWFSVTPEIIAEHHASRCSSDVVIDAFAGVGGNAIQFALRSEHVIAIDKDPMKIAYAKHNAEIYGVSDRIDFVVGDFFQLAQSLKANVIFLSPPWGGPEYLKATSYDMSMLQPEDGFTLFKTAQRVAPNIVLYIPRNVDLKQLKELSCLSNPPMSFEIEKNFVNNRAKAITVYYGDMFQQSDVNDLDV